MMYKSLEKRLKCLERMRGRADPEIALLGEIKYLNGTVKKIYANKQGMLTCMETFSELIGNEQDEAIECTITEYGRENTLFNIIYQIINK